jgi:hypothetical protein
MKIKFERLPTAHIEDFADEHNLTMVIKPINSKLLRDFSFSARFENVNVPAYVYNISRTGRINGCFGLGNTPDEAIKDYAKRLSKQILVIESGEAINCPIFTIKESYPLDRLVGIEMLEKRIYELEKDVLALILKKRLL